MQVLIDTACGFLRAQGLSGRHCSRQTQRYKVFLSEGIPRRALQCGRVYI